MHTVSKRVRLSEITVKKLNEDRSICQGQRRSPMTLLSANIRFVPIFERVRWRECHRGLLMLKWGLL